MKTYWFFYILPILIISCNSQEKEFRNVIQQAGDNGSELIKVIDFFEKKGDKQKLDAAYYLILNMANKSAYDQSGLQKFFGIYDQVNDLHAQGYASFSYLDSIVGVKIDSLESYYGSPNAYRNPRKSDLENITAKLLIENIELAFEAWRTKPWAKHISYEQFREWILPYRIYDEPVQNWRPVLYEKYDIFLDSLSDKSDPKELARLVNTHIYKNWKHLDNFNKFPHIPGINDVERYSGGICEHHYAFLVSILRSLGVACTIDYTPQWRHWVNKHSWISLIDKGGETIYFNAGNPNFYYTKRVPLGAKGSTTKVYRRSYTIQEKTPAYFDEDGLIPSEFAHNGSYDVTDEYTFEQTALPVSFDEKITSKVVYLEAFDQAYYKSVVAWTLCDGKNANFNNVGIPAVYIPGYFQGNVYYTGLPLAIDDNQQITEIVASETETTDLYITRKNPVGDSMYVYINELIGAELQVSDNPYFKNAKTIYTISDSIDHYIDIPISTEKSSKYIRLKASDGSGRINIAEIEFYSKKNDVVTKVEGVPISNGIVSEGKVQNCFDEDLATSVCITNSPWVGVAFAEEVKVNMVRLLPRNNLNVIEIGDIYELFYFNNTEWESLGRQQAEYNHLLYPGVPANALYTLRNLSGGKEERIFTYDQNEQIWW